VDSGSILGVPPLRPALLVDISAAESREDQTCRADVMNHLSLSPLMNPYLLDDDDPDDEDDDFDDDDEGDDEEDEDEEEVETWQVARLPDSR
jgi:hypothetical protein